MTINQSTNNAESYLVLICRGFFYWGGGIVCLFSWILFCSVSRVFWRLFILFCCYCYFFVVVIFFKIIGVFFLWIFLIWRRFIKYAFFRDIAFFIVIVAIPVFFRLIKILIKLKGLVQTNSVSENTHSDSV